MWYCPMKATKSSRNIASKSPVHWQKSNQLKR